MHEGKMAFRVIGKGEKRKEIKMEYEICIIFSKFSQ